MTAGHWQQGLLPALVLVPLLGALALFGVRRLGDAAAAWAGTGISAVTLVLAVVAVQQGAVRGLEHRQLEVNEPWVPALGLRLHLGLDGVSAPLVLLTAALGLLVCGHLVRVRPVAGDVRRLIGCVLVVMAGATLTFVSLDLFLFFIAFETVLIPMWFVIGFWGDDQQPVSQLFPGGPALGGEDRRRDAALRFVLYTALGSAVMLLGIILVVVRAGTADLVELTALHGSSLSRGVQVVAAALIVLGLAVKTPMWPFHTWLPPAHTIAPTGGSVLLAGVLLKLGTYGLIRIAVPVLPDGMRVLAPWLGSLGVAGIVWAGLACLAESDLKRLVAFSSVAHMGFILLGIASMTTAGLQGALFGNVAHGVVSALLFFVAGALKNRHHTADLTALGAGLRDRLPRLGWLLTLGAIAGLGLPGLAVFWGELLAIAGAWSARGDGALGGLAVPLAVIAAFGTLIAAAYWLRVLRTFWAGQPSPESAALVMGDATHHESLTTAPLVAATVVLGLVPGPLLGLTAPVVTSLLRAGGAS